MGLPLSPDEVRRHLIQLGYKNVSEEQLQEFVKDLKRLIRYEEKQSRIRNLIELKKSANAKRERKLSNETIDSFRTSSSGSSSSSGHFSADEDDGRSRNKKKSQSFRSEIHSLQASTESISTSTSTSSSSSYSVASSGYVQEDSRRTSNRTFRKKSQHKIDNIQVKVDVSGSKSRDEIDLATRDERPATRIARSKSVGIVYEQILPKQPEFPAKATASFIRVPPKRILPKSDPVALFHQYREQWEKTKFPGDDSTKQLRWRVREWMIGHRE